MRLLINGRSGSGKSNMLVNLLLNDNYPYKNLFDGDNIYLLENGQIKSQGRFEELIESDKNFKIATQSLD